jgi:hypothetical protein
MALSRVTYPLRHGYREVTMVSVQFDTNGSSAPDAVVDPGEYIGAPTYAATGLVTVPLNDRYARVVVVGVELESTTTDSDVSVDSVTEGAASANQVVLHHFTPSTGLALESNNEAVHLTLALYKAS